MSDIGKDGHEGGSGGGRVGDDACAELVGGSFEAEAEEAAGSTSRSDEMRRRSRDESDARGLGRGESFFLLLEAWVILLDLWKTLEDEG